MASPASSLSCPARSPLLMVKFPTNLSISLLGRSAQTSALTRSRARSSSRECVLATARRSFQSCAGKRHPKHGISNQRKVVRACGAGGGQGTVSPSSWSVRMKTLPPSSLVRSRIMSAGTLSPASIRMTSPTRMSELGTLATSPVDVSRRYRCWWTASRPFQKAFRKESQDCTGDDYFMAHKHGRSQHPGRGRASSGNPTWLFASRSRMYRL